jgi:hypothetical protein
MDKAIACGYGYCLYSHWPLVIAYAHWLLAIAYLLF